MNVHVTIKETGGQSAVLADRVVSNVVDEWDAIHSVIVAQWGRKAGFFRDQGLADSGIFGQVTWPARGQSAVRTLTGVVVIYAEVEESRQP